MVRKKSQQKNKFFQKFSLVLFGWESKAKNKNKLQQKEEESRGKKLDTSAIFKILPIQDALCEIS